MSRKNDMDFFELNRKVRKRGGWKKCAKEAGVWLHFKLCVISFSGILLYLYYVSTLPKIG